MAADGTRKQLVPTARIPGGQTLIFIASEAFQWRFPEQLRLFLALIDLEKTNCVTTGNRPGDPNVAYSRITITAEHARNVRAT